MDVSLPPQLEEFVRSKMQSGLYGSPSEVVREALRLMQEKDEVHRLKLDRLRDALIHGERSGPAEGFSIDGLMAELDEEVRQESSGVV